jgi:conjugal transfer pilus assembly protein TraE
MFLKKYLSKAENDNREVFFMRALVFCLGAIMLIQTAVMYSMIGTERTILVPPEINRTFWVGSNTASSEYLEQMAYWYAGLALTITPQSADYQDDLFLKYAAPASSGQLQADMGARADFLKKNNTSTQFSVRSIKVDKDNLRVALSGTLDTWTSDKKAGERTATYMVGFKFINGKLYVSNFKETSDQDPFGDSIAPKP